jgi:hypothetical protein
VTVADSNVSKAMLARRSFSIAAARQSDPVVFEFQTSQISWQISWQISQQNLLAKYRRSVSAHKS